MTTPAPAPRPRRPHHHRDEVVDWQGLRIVAPALAAARRLGFTLGEITDALNHPESHHPQPVAGRSAYSRGAVTVIVADDIVLSVRERASFLADQPGRRVHGKGGSPTVDSVGAMIQLLHEHGFEVAPGGSHYRVTHPDQAGRRYTLPLTPSDNRWSRNFIVGIRTTFGIDLLRH